LTTNPRRRPPFWLALAGIAVLACSLFNRGIPTVDERPADFSLVYEWREGSLPPPYHYETTISVAPDGAGTITLVPDYPGPDVPVWTEAFSLDTAALDSLYVRLAAEGAFSTRWRAQDDPPVGGSYHWLTLTTGGQQIEIPPFPIDSQADAADRIEAAVTSLVPADVWDSLHARREQYVAEHGG
jgi:hypothetical protein